ncbi:MAG: nucleotidyltransferase family protein [Candidatus Omnitrophica bacterium]|nr:nucleotidyltransferase family protein [Candidatus Omnitrophota bacterium]
MKAILLCAGYATRLYPLTQHQPKPLLLIAGEVLLNHLIKKLELVPSLESIVIVSNDRFYNQFCQWRETVTQKIPISVIHDGTQDPEHRLGAIQDLKLALRQECDQTDVLVLAGDNLFDSELLPFVTFAESKRPAAVVGVYDVQDRVLSQKYGLIKTDSSGKITAFFEKPKDPPTTLASMGIYYFPKETLRYVDRYLEGNRNPDAPGYYIGWLAKETSIFVFPFRGAWFDIGDLNSYRKADQHFQVFQKKRNA